MPRKKIEQDIKEDIKEEVKNYDKDFCASCGRKLNNVACKHDGFNFCSITCYNQVVK